MSMFTVDIVPMSERKYMLVPLDKITVLNSRNREEKQFQDNVSSIDTIGLLKPIVVNERNLKRDGFYELVCGEGRFIAHQRLEKKKIPAEVINVDRKTALLCSLVENIARVPPDTMWFAREMCRMKESGMPIKKICQIVGKTEKYVAHYINLVETGEERLIKGVEQGLFAMSFATIVAKSSTEDIQHVLMDAFDSGIISSSNVTKVRNLIELRMIRGKQTPRSRPAAKPQYSLKDLKRDINVTTEEKEGFVRQATAKENRLLILLDGLACLQKDKSLVAILKEAGLNKKPKLLGQYGI
jgi:ParB family chromosome partitioning protein